MHYNDNSLPQGLATSGQAGASSDVSGSAKVSSAIFNSCKYCGLSSVCASLPKTQKAITALSKKETVIAKQSTIFTQGQGFKAFYAIRSGAVKTVLNGHDNVPQITGFYLPGDIVGLDGVSTKSHTNTAIALETTSLCAIPFDNFEQLMSQSLATQRPFIELLGQEIHEQQRLFMQQNQKNAEQKMAALIASIATRYKKQGYSETHFTLPMARTDMANYLGLTVETVSRVLNKLTKENYIDVNGKSLNHVDVKRLTELAQS